MRFIIAIMIAASCFAAATETQAPRAVVKAQAVLEKDVYRVYKLAAKKVEEARKDAVKDLTRELEKLTRAAKLEEAVAVNKAIIVLEKKTVIELLTEALPNTDMLGRPLGQHPARALVKTHKLVTASGWVDLRPDGTWRSVWSADSVDRTWKPVKEGIELSKGGTVMSVWQGDWSAIESGFMDKKYNKLYKFEER